MSLLTCTEALALIATRIADLPTTAEHERVPLQHASGRVLASNLSADRDQPPFHRSTRDGYAIRANDAGGTLQVVGSIRAGDQWNGEPLQSGQTVEIMTGAPVPDGADAVVMVEHVTLGDSVLRLAGGRTVQTGENIVPRGSEASSGDTLLTVSTRLSAAGIALAASVGAAEVEVFRKPVTAIIATGDELVDIHQTPGPMQIRNSNSHGLATMVEAHGGVAQVLPPAADTLPALEHALDSAADADMLVFSGGVSAGKYDFVEEALLRRGAELLFTGVAIQPGKPAVFGFLPQRDGRRAQWVFGLPGNPVSTQVTALLFAMPLLRALGGESHPAPHFGSAVLTDPVRVKPGLTRFLPARVESGLAGATVRLTGWQGSGDLASNARANCYVVVPPEVDVLEPGSVVAVLLRGAGAEA